MTDEQFIKSFQENYNRVLNYTGGGSDQQQLMMSLACKYTLAKRPFSGVLLQKVIDQIEEQTHEKFPIRNLSTISYRFAAQLILGGGDLQQEILRLNENDVMLSAANFKKSPFRAIGAMFIQGERQQHAIRAKQFFNEMNRNQPILTSNEDIPYAVYLTTNRDSQPAMQVKTIYRYYSELKKQQFTMGNHLQALAQILGIYSSEYNEILLRYVVRLKDELIKRGIKVKKMHYPFLGILALAASNESKIDEIVSLYNKLLAQKPFKNAKQYALIVAIQKIVQDLTEVHEMVDLTPLSQVTQIIELLDIANIILEFGRFLPSGISGIIDFFN